MARRIGTVEKKYTAWSGSEADLQALVDCVERHVAIRREDAVRTETEGIDERHRQDRSEWIARRFRVSVAVEEKSAEEVLHRGTSVSDVFDSEEIEASKLKTLTITGGGDKDDGTMSIKMAHHAILLKGVQLRIEGPTDWTRYAKADLDPLLRGRQPWWGILRTNFGAAAVSVFLTLGASLWLGAVDPWVEDGDFVSDGVAIAATVLLYGLCALFAGFGLAWLLSRASILPAFEVLKDRRDSRGRRAVGIVGALLINLVASAIWVLIS
jgi:hypothetical protein